VCSESCASQVHSSRAILRLMYRNLQKSNRVGAFFLISLGAAFGAAALFAAVRVFDAPSFRAGNVIGVLLLLLATTFFIGYGYLLWQAQDATLLKEPERESKAQSPNS